MFFKVTTNITDALDEPKVFDFDERCNCVDYKDPTFCVFKHRDYHTKTEYDLMLIPYDKIDYIERIEEADDVEDRNI